MFAVLAADGLSERTRRVRPSRGWYWVSVALVVAAVACVVPAAVGLVSITAQIQQFQRVEAAGQGVVVSDQPGQHTLYVESTITDDLFPPM